MTKRSYSARAMYRRLFAVARPYWPHLGGILALSLLSAPLALLTPMPLKVVVDSAIGGRPLPAVLAAVVPRPLGGSNGGAVFVAIALLLAVALLNQLQGITSWVLQARTGELLLLRFRSQLFAHAQRLSLKFHDTRGSADSAYRIQYDAMAVQNMAVNGLVPFATSTITLVAMLAVTARLDWPIAAVAVILMPALFLVVRLSRRRIRDQWADVKESESAAMAVVQEVLGALRVVKAFGQEDREHARFVEQSHRAVRGQMALARTQGAFDTAVGMLIASGMGAALLIGTLHVRSGRISLGVLLVLTTYMAQLLAPIESITRRMGQLQGAFASAERAFELLDQSPEVIERPGARPLSRARGAVSCRHVSFAYEPGRPVLQDISFEIPAGARVGIAGRSGAGKTTLINLLTRFYDPASGAVLLDGVDLRDYRVADLRRQYAMVLQEPVLFSTTIGENIAYARPEAGQDAIVDAARAAGAHDFIFELPQGYDTVVGERGMSLSGGERQRLSLARAFLADAPLLLLDEPTSSVDLHTEAVIMEALERLMRGRTTIMIAHRLSTLDRCDMRIVLEAGRLARAESEGLIVA